MGILRLILALTVVFAHSPWNDGYAFVGGQIAVQLFYVISGFLITYTLTHNPHYTNLRKFYANRALRIYPLYFIALAIALALFAHKARVIALYGDIPWSAKSLLAASQAVIFGQDAVLFSAVKNQAMVFSTNFLDSDVPLHDGLFLPQAWSIALELYFYLLAPFIVRSKRLTLIMFAISASIKFWLMTGTDFGNNDPWTYRFFPAELCLFMLGAIACQHFLPRLEALWGAAKPMHTAAVAVLALCILLYFKIPMPDIWKAPILFILFCLLLPLAFLFQKDSKVDRYLGELSYPIYIFHLLAISQLSRPLTKLLTVKWSLGLNPELTASCTAAVTATVVAMVAVHCIDRPLNRRFKRNATPH